MSENDEMISQFTNLTNVDVERARFYLESSAWQLEVALASFYETGDDVEIQDVTERSDSPEIIKEVKREPSDKPPASGQQNKESKPSSTASGGPRINTIAGLNQADSNSSDEEEGQAFYAGGSEQSGQQILGPGKKKNDFVTEMFKSVKDAGAEVVDPRQPSTSKRSQVFSGAGYRLGQTPTESKVVASTSSSAKPDSPVPVVLKMWKTGFSIDDGPVREYTDPNNLEFLESVRNGEVPNELVQQARGREVHLDMEDHRHEDFIQPKNKIKAFAGKGHLLGSPAPATLGLSPPASESVKATNEEQARASISVDDSQPTTTVQVRLVDGTRLAARFNHSHTIADLRQYIVIARPEFQHRTFQLRTSFPNAELADESKTLSEAKVLNAAILQRLV